MRFSAYCMLVLLHAAHAKLMPYNVIPDEITQSPEPPISTGQSLEMNEEKRSGVDATVTDNGFTDDTIASVQALMDKLSVTEEELIAKLRQLQSSVASSQALLQKAAVVEEFEEAMRLKALLATLATDTETVEKALADTKSQLAQASKKREDFAQAEKQKQKEKKLKALRAELDAIDPTSLVNSSRNAYRARYEQQLKDWWELIDSARPILHYILKKAADVGTKELEIGHSLSCSPQLCDYGHLIFSKQQITTRYNVYGVCCVFEIKCTSDGCGTDGELDHRHLFELFPSGIEIASYMKVFSDRRKLRAMIFEYRRRGYNMSMSNVVVKDLSWERLLSTPYGGNVLMNLWHPLPAAESRDQDVLEELTYYFPLGRDFT